MSADNGLVLKPTSEGWELREYCASYAEPWDKLRLIGVYPTAEEALEASQEVYTEYGISFVKDAA